MSEGKFTPREVVAIEQLQSLAKRWPNTLMLFASGSLHVIKRADYKEGLNLDKQGIPIHGISCDGGQGDI